MLAAGEEIIYIYMHTRVCLPFNKMVNGGGVTTSWQQNGYWWGVTIWCGGRSQFPASKTVNGGGVTISWQQNG